MTRSGRRAAALTTGTALLLAFTGITPPASAAPGEADPPPAQSIAQFCEAVPGSFEPFTDVHSDVHKPAIECAGFGEIVRGGPGASPPERYQPGQKVRRDQMASFIAQMMDRANDVDSGDRIAALPPYDGTPEFSDVDESNVHFEAINRLAQVGIVEGGPGDRSSDEYGPELNTQREQMATFVNAAVAFMTGSGFGPGSDYFVDDEASVHEDDINAVASAGIAIGDGADRYSPYQEVPRDQMASYVARPLAALHENGLIEDIGTATAAVVHYDQRDERVVAGADISGTIWGLTNADSVRVSGECVADGALSDADADREGFQFSVSTRANSAEGRCAITFTSSFENGSIDTDTIQVRISGSSGQSGQTFIVAPQEPRQEPTGDPIRFSVGARYDDQEFTGPVDVTLFPCPNVGPTSSPVTFKDADDDALADGIASTEHGQAYISQVEGTTTERRGRYVDAQRPGEDGVLEFTTVARPDPDCAVIVVFQDRNDDQQLSLDTENRPAEPFGVGKATWTGTATAVAAVDADGRALILDGQTGEVRRVLIEGINVDDPADNAIAVTPDRSVVYVVRPGADSSQDPEIVRGEASGGDPQTVTQGRSPAVSPDGGTLAYVRFVDTGEPAPEPTIRLRNLGTGAERELRAVSQDFHGIWDLAFTQDGSRLAFTAGEIKTSVHVVDRDAASLDESRRLGPENSDASWDDVTALGDNRLAVVERCCQFPDADPERWHVISVDATTGAVNDGVFGQDRTEATLVDARDDEPGLIAVRRGGPDGGTLLRWDGSGQPRTITDGVIVAAW